MLALEEIPPASRERLDQIGAADLVIGLLVPAPNETLEAAIARARESVGSLYTPARAVVMHPVTETPLAAREDDMLRTLPFPLMPADPSVDALESIYAACNTVFAVGAGLGARAIAVIVSDPRDVTAQWIYRLVRPVLELDFDLVTPCYLHGKFEGLLNTAIVAPLTRALYGRRIQHPLGPDFGVAGRFARRLTAASPGRERRSLASVTLDAVCDGFEISQANVGVRHYPATDWMNQSSVLVQILDPVFREIEHRASFWQRVRDSQPVPLFGDLPGDANHRPEAADSLDIHRMFESFELGLRDLGEVWGAILPPGTLLELNKLARGRLDNFHLPDRLWARIIYDFAIAYHLRTLNSDHLLRAMTPLYLAWVVSFALDSGQDPAERIEQLAIAFEQAKPYAVSRWRWPDRFNP